MGRDMCHHTRLPGLYPVFNLHCPLHISATGFRSFQRARPPSPPPAFLWLRSASIIGGWQEGGRTRGAGSFRLSGSKLTTNCHLAPTCQTQNLCRHFQDTAKSKLSWGKECWEHCPTILYVSCLKAYIYDKCKLCLSIVSADLFVVLGQTGSWWPTQPNQPHMKSKLIRIWTDALSILFLSEI